MRLNYNNYVEYSEEEKTTSEHSHYIQYKL